MLRHLPISNRFAGSKTDAIAAADVWQLAYLHGIQTCIVVTTRLWNV